MKDIYDVIVIGGGPAGLAAAMYLARARCRVLVLERESFGGQIAITEELMNYPGIEKTGGKELADTLRRQAEAFGAELEQAEAVELELSGDIKSVKTERGERRALGVLLAMGAKPRAAGFLGEAEHMGRGVACCATCDGELFTGRDVFVVGGGYAAAEESVYLTRYARSVTVLIRRDDFSCAASVAERARENEKITILTNTVLEEVAGENGLTYARYKNTATGEVTEVKREAGESFGVFVFAGYDPATELVKGKLETDERGYIVADAEGKTEIPGVYAAGDVRAKSLRQAVTAAGDGALAANELEKYVEELRRRTGLKPERPAPAKSAAVSEGGAAMFSPELRGQLGDVLARLEAPLLLKLRLDDRPVSAELERFAGELAEMSDKLRVSVEERGGSSGELPEISLCRGSGVDTGIAFHGVPGGHEFASFALALYNTAGPGQPIGDDERRRIAGIASNVDMKILVTLSCSMCPELVCAAQRIAAENPLVSAHVYDIRHFEQLRERWGVMSVPCLIINDEKVYFGRKNLSQLLSLMEELANK